MCPPRDGRRTDHGRRRATGIRLELAERGKWTRNADASACFLDSAERQPRKHWVGLLARRERACTCPRPLHLPRCFRTKPAEWCFEAAPSLTVAGPRRIHTGLPCYAPARGTQSGPRLCHITPTLRFIIDRRSRTGMRSGSNHSRGICGTACGRSPASASTTVAVIVMLALGIGANVAIFTLLNAIWLRPLPYRDAGRLVTLEDSFVREGINRSTPTVPEFLDVRELEQVVRVDGVPRSSRSATDRRTGAGARVRREGDRVVLSAARRRTGARARVHRHRQSRRPREGGDPVARPVAPRVRERSVGDRADDHGGPRGRTRSSASRPPASPSIIPRSAFASPRMSTCRS